MTIPLVDDSTTEPTAVGRYTLRSVSRAIDVLDILALSKDALSVGEVPRQLNCSNSTAFTILQTLEERNLASSRGDGSGMTARSDLAPAGGRRALAGRESGWVRGCTHAPTRGPRPGEARAASNSFASRGTPPATEHTTKGSDA